MADRLLKLLYRSPAGRAALRPLTGRRLSQAAGAFLDRPLSKGLIRPFVAQNHIDLSQFYADDFACFNDCFRRKIRPGLRPIDRRPEALIAPCDGLLTVYPVTGDTVFPVKQSRYTLPSLLGDPRLAARYRDGLCLIFRLCVHHYHRYCYVDSGEKGENIFLPGKLHTVRPVALAAGPVFSENCRGYTLIRTRSFGPVVQMEVGAMLVGKFHNYHGPGPVVRGEEKGTFLYGGSTVILLLEAGRAEVLPPILAASVGGQETEVRMGQRVGTAARTADRSS